VSELKLKVILLFSLSIILLSSCAPKIVQTGKASYYADYFKNRPTASGDLYKPRKLTAAHKSLPFGTKVTVINRQNGRHVKVIINDRGPFIAGRVIDLSQKAAKKLNMIDAGIADVKIKYKLIRRH